MNRSRTAVTTAQAQASYMQSCMWCVFYAVGVVGMLVVYGLLQERIMTVPYGNDVFQYSVFLVFCNRVAAVWWAVPMVACYEFKSFKPRASKWKYLVIALSNVLATTCQYESLKYVSFAVQMLGKSFKMMPVMLWGIVISGKSYGCVDWLVAGGVTAGVTGFLLAGPTEAPLEQSDSLLGLLWLLAFLAMDGLTSTMQEKLFQEKVPKYNQMFWVNLISSLVSFVTLLSSRTLVPAFSFVGEHSMVLFDAITLSISAVFAQYFIYTQVENFGALVFAATMNVRQVVSIIVSYIYYGHGITTLQVVGLSACFACLFFKVLLGFREATSTSASEKKPLIKKDPDAEEPKAAAVQP